MHKAALYQRSNGLQRRDAKQAIEEFSHVFQWRDDGFDSILDIGCGSADVTIDYLLPILPETYERLIGVDISEEMVNYARQQYPHPRISFDKFDLSVDIEKQAFGNTEPFDHITSFYCLHWVQNQESAIQNMYKLLKPNGDMLVVFLAQNPIFEIYTQMSQSKKWSKYMTDVDRFISPYQYSKNPADQFGNLLSASGFTEYSVEIREKLFVFEGIDLLKKSVKAVNPFIERIPIHEHDAFLDDYFNHVMNMRLVLDDIHTNSKTCRILTPYKLIVAYARK